jgi:hypothetical protein
MRKRDESWPNNMTELCLYHLVFCVFLPEKDYASVTKVLFFAPAMAINAESLLPHVVEKVRLKKKCLSATDSRLL